MAKAKSASQFYLIGDKIFFPLSPNYLIYICDKEVFEMLTIEELESHVNTLITGLQMVVPPHTIH